MAKFDEVMGFIATDGEENSAYDFDTRRDYDESGGTLATFSNQGDERASISNDGEWSGPVLDKGGAVYNVQHPDFGATGDGSTNDTSAIDSAINTAETNNGWVWVPEGTYVVDAITVNDGIRGIIGPGTLKQNSAGSNILEPDTADDLLIQGLTFEGVGGTSSESSNSGILAADCSRLRVVNCTFHSFRFVEAIFRRCTELLYKGNYVRQTIGGAQFRACSQVSVVNNVWRNPASPSSTFITGPQLESTDGHTDGVCTDVVIAGNHVDGYVNAQAILAHAGQRVAITGNVLNDVLSGISINSFNNSDTLEDISITGNVYVGTTTTGTSRTGNAGINIGGGSSAFTPSNISIKGNVIRAANKVSEGTNEGGIKLNDVENVSVEGNAIIDPDGNGIVLHSTSSSGVVIAGNVIQDVATTNGEANGIRVAVSSNEAVITGNHFENLTDALRVTASNTDVVFRDNHYTNITNVHFSGVSNGVVVEGEVNYSDGDTTPSVRHYARYMTIANGSSTTITDLDDGEEGQKVTLHFQDGNSTIDRTNAKLSGGANFSGAADDILELVLRGSTWIEVGRATGNS